jgi:hypothetical protein
METTKIVPAHTDVRRLIEVDHYEDHEKRTESAEFKRVKDELHKEHVGCWIGNGRCEGGLEIHHNIVEYATLSEVDFAKVQAKFPFMTTPENKQGMQVLCRKHHRDPIFGKHYTTEPEWILQAFMREEALDHFELAGYTELYYEEFLKKGNTPAEAKKLAKDKAVAKVASFKK